MEKQYTSELFDGDRMPNLAVGRLAVHTAFEFMMREADSGYCDRATAISKMAALTMLLDPVAGSRGSFE